MRPKHLHFWQVIRWYCCWLKSHILDTDALTNATLRHLRRNDPGFLNDCADKLLLPQNHFEYEVSNKYTFLMLSYWDLEVVCFCSSTSQINTGNTCRGDILENVMMWCVWLPVLCLPDRVIMFIIIGWSGSVTWRLSLSPPPCWPQPRTCSSLSRGLTMIAHLAFPPLDHGLIDSQEFYSLSSQNWFSTWNKVPKK